MSTVQKAEAGSDDTLHMQDTQAPPSDHDTISLIINNMENGNQLPVNDNTTLWEAIENTNNNTNIALEQEGSPALPIIKRWVDQEIEKESSKDPQVAQDRLDDLRTFISELNEEDAKELLISLRTEYQEAIRMAKWNLNRSINQYMDIFNRNGVSIQPINITEQVHFLNQENFIKACRATNREAGITSGFVSYPQGNEARRALVRLPLILYFENNTLKFGGYSSRESGRFQRMIATAEHEAVHLLGDSTILKTRLEGNRIRQVRGFEIHDFLEDTVTGRTDWVRSTSEIPCTAIDEGFNVFLYTLKELGNDKFEDLEKINTSGNFPKGYESAADVFLYLCKKDPSNLQRILTAYLQSDIDSMKTLLEDNDLLDVMIRIERDIRKEAAKGLY